MSEADATDPVGALREWCAECDGARSGILGDLHRVEERNRAAGCGGYGDVVAKARAVLSAAPALLARIEAGEGLLRKAHGWMPLVTLPQGPSMALTRDIDAIEAWLEGKDARNALAAMQARAEKAEARGDAYERDFENMTERADREQKRAEAAESKIAEVAPVVEAAASLAELANDTADRLDSDIWPETIGRLRAGAETVTASVTALRAARSLRGAPVPDVHVAVSPESVDDALRGVCGNQDRSSPRRCDRPAGHDGEHDQSNWPTGEMTPRSLRGAGEGNAEARKGEEAGR